MAYIDAFLAAVPKDSRDTYLEFSRLSHEVFRDFGALNIVECWADDVPDGELTSMPMAVQAGPDEDVALSWIVWPDKATRDDGFRRVMEDPRMSPDRNPMPFDGRRMIYGGFVPILGTP